MVEDEVNLKSLEYLPYIAANNGIVEQLGYAFINLTEYNKEEIIGKTVSEVFKMMRIYVNSNLDGIETKVGGYLFTKQYECRKVIIITKFGLSSSSMLYIFLEKPDSRLEHKFPVVNQMCADNNFGVAVFGVPGVILLKASQKWLSYLDEPYNTKNNSIGRKIKEIVPDWKQSTIEEMWNTVLTTERSYCNSEFRYVSNKRGVTYWDISLTPIYEHGELKYFVEMASDITDKILNKQRIEEQARIIEQQKNELEKTLKMQEDFFSFMSHEFKTPLTIINTAVQAIETLCSKELPKKAKVFMKKIRQNSFRQLRLINNLLDITRSDSGYVKICKRNADIVSIARAITESVCLYAQQKGIHLKFSSDLDKRVIAIDDEKFERILLNLLSNALKFTPISKSVYVNVLLKQQYICIEVRDEGIGIPKEKQSIIFERFGQVRSSLIRNSEGTGIGLYLVKLLVDALGGEISVESEEGHGTVFTILLPDIISNDEAEQLSIEGICDHRLIQAVDIEFSDIYLT